MEVRLSHCILSNRDSRYHYYANAVSDYLWSYPAHVICPQVTLSQPKLLHSSLLQSYCVVAKLLFSSVQNPPPETASNSSSLSS